VLNYSIFILVIAGCYGLLALSACLSWGMAGMANMGLVGFFAIGAYTSALLSTAFNITPTLAVLVACVVGGLAGLVVTLSTLQLRDDYLAIVTLGFAEVVKQVASNEIWLTGGTDGVSGVPGIVPRGWGASYHGTMLVLVSVVVLIVFAGVTRLAGSPWGRAVRALREDQIVAMVAGKNIVRFKAQAFAISTAIAALSGAIYAHYTSYIAPDLFQPLITTYVFLAAVVGGATRPLGAVIGAYTLLVLLEATRFIAEEIPGVSAVQSAALREIIVGALLIVALRLAPGGFFRERSQTAARTRKIFS
jgi:branched-chain amino acid transport system permease protein